MSFCHAYTGSGGWPLTIVMTPEREPFFAGTYFPKHGKYGMPGIMNVLSAITDKWNKDKNSLIKSSKMLREEVEKIEGFHNIDGINKTRSLISESLIHETYKQLKDTFEPKYGGFSYSPKFPAPHNILFLFRYYYYTKDECALLMAEKTLESMYKGGIFDHIGYGFCRYSTDNKWLVPHFEKMLYDNALLSMVYSEAYAITKKELYKEIAEKIFKYILEKMTSLEGGFYSAEDADSEGLEGKFYLWDKQEVTKLLSPEEAKEFCKLYGIDSEGNFQGKSIPNLVNTDLQELCENKVLKSRIEKVIEKLFTYREERVHPFKDDKVLTSWNGLMIASLAIGGRAFLEKTYIDAAEKACSFIFENLVDKNGRLLGRYRDGESANLGFLEDYAFLVWGLIELYQSTFKTNYLKKALELNKDMIRLFRDEVQEGFYLYGKDGEKLILRPKELYDGALPSGNSIAAVNLVRLSKITGDKSLKDIVEEMFHCFGEKVYENPSAYIGFVTAYLQSTASNVEIYIRGEKEEK